MPRAWYIYNKTASGTTPQLVAANYYLLPYGEFTCDPDFNACFIYVYYGLNFGSLPPFSPPSPLSNRIRSYIHGNIATAQNRPATGKIFAYSGPLN